ncbi:hypothetical protein pipiens_012566 [Culex pipiens pipiens]|uniref:Uncharacterized protein n=1 Tax=Culex pipiens pipiens TaxID=38569 RepID=A0ABD1D1X7_CULPP
MYDLHKHPEEDQPQRASGPINRDLLAAVISAKLRLKNGHRQRHRQLRQQQQRLHPEHHQNQQQLWPVDFFVPRRKVNVGKRSSPAGGHDCGGGFQRGRGQCIRWSSSGHHVV